MRNLNTTLTQGTEWKRLALFAIPLLFRGFLQQLYTAADSAILGRFAGDIPLAAVGASASAIAMLLNMFLAVAAGAGTIYAAAFGANDRESMRLTTQTALGLSLIIGIPLTILSLAFSRPILEAMHTPADVLPDALAYLRICSIGFVPMLLYNVCAAIIQAGGDSKRPLYFLLASGFVNILLDLLFVAVFRWSAAGAAVATVIAQVLSAVLGLSCLSSIASSTHGTDKLSFKLSHPMVRRIARLAVPLGVQSIMFDVSNFLIQVELNRFGALAMAATAAYYRLDMFTFMPLRALGLALSTFISQNIGAGSAERNKKATRAALLMGLFTSVSVSLVLIVFIRPLLSIFTAEQETVDLGVTIMWTMAPYLSLWVFSCIFESAICGTGAAKQVTVITALCICCSRLVWLYTVLPAAYSLTTLLYCYPVSWGLSSVVMTLYYRFGDWKKEMHSLGVYPSS